MILFKLWIYAGWSLDETKHAHQELISIKLPLQTNCWITCLLVNKGGGAGEEARAVAPRPQAERGIAYTDFGAKDIVGTVRYA